MSNISVDDLFHHTPKTAGKRTWSVFILALAGLLTFLCYICTGPTTVQDYQKKFIKKVNKDLANPSSDLRKYIESAHLTVTVQSAEIIQCDISTIDKSNKAGKDGANIDKISMLIRFNWKDRVSDDGHTDLRWGYDVQNQRQIECKIADTTALINTKNPLFWANPFWATVGPYLWRLFL